MDGKGSKGENAQGGRSRRAASGGGGWWWGLISGPGSATEWLDDFRLASSPSGPQFPHLKMGQKFLPRLSHNTVERTQDPRVTELVN